MTDPMPEPDALDEDAPIVPTARPVPPEPNVDAPNDPEGVPA